MSTADMVTGHMYVGGTVLPYRTNYNSQSFHKVGVTEYVIELLSCLFQCSSKAPQSDNKYKNPHLGFLMLFCHVFIDAPEKPDIRSIFHTGDSSGSHLHWL